VYPQLSPPTLNSQDSNRVCNALALLQCVASHNETRPLFLNGNHLCLSIETASFSPLLFIFQAHIPLFLYPFLNTVSKSRPFEFLRLTSLGVIGALVKVFLSFLFFSFLSFHIHFNLLSFLFPNRMIALRWSTFC